MEWLLVGSVLVLAFLCPHIFSGTFARLELWFKRLSFPAGALVIVGLSAVALRAALLPTFPMPEPIVHDEFGYLLASDTFSHGRVTNPTHPMWVHFETFSVLQKPTYQCIAQPAQGMILALGKVVFGHPFWGVLLSIGLMCAATTWMLQAWLSAEWAFLGGLLAVMRYAVLSNWGDSYWGGALGALGGALVLGALPRIKSQPRPSAALLMVVGLAILANSRPYEGLILSLPVAGSLFVWMFNHNRLTVALRKVVFPASLALALAAAGTMYYFHRVTGSSFLMPYQIERETYGIAPYFLWQHSRSTPVYNNPIMEKMYVQEEAPAAEFFRSFEGAVFKFYLFWSFYLGPAVSLPFLMLAFTLPSNVSWRTITSQTRSLFLISGFFVGGIAMECFYNSRYSAPATSLVLAFFLLALQRLRNWNAAGLFLARTIPIVCVCSFVLRAFADPLHIPLRTYYEFAWHQRGESSFGRAAIEYQLENTPGNHLVLVHYSPQHEPFAEWVYNDADIDRSRIVWAREISPGEDKRLLQYFSSRTAWVLNADNNPPVLKQLTR